MNNAQRRQAHVEKYLRARGLRDNTHEDWTFMYPHMLETRAGPLLVHVNDGWVAMRFVELDRAKTVLPHGYGERLNGYSGKYNVHFSDEKDLERCEQELARVLEPVTA